MGNKAWLMGTGVFIMALLCFGFLAIPQPAESADEVVKYNSNVCISKNGALIECKHNVITNSGKDMIKNAIALGGSDKASNLSLGQGTAPVAASTTLNLELTASGLQQKAATYGSNGGNGNWSYWTTWTSTADAQVVNSTGLYNATTPILFAGTTFTSTTLQTNDQITVNYTISIS